VAQRTRRTGTEIEGEVEGRRIAATLGREVRATRRRQGRTLDQLAERIGIGRSRLSQVERGLGHSAPLQTWVSLGIALGRPLAVSLSRPLGEPREPADAGHLRIQEHILALAARTGRPGTFELPTKPLDPSRSTDVGIRDATRQARIHVECWNTIGDLGAATRATTRKLHEAQATWPDDSVTTVWVVAATAGNREILRRYPRILASAFPGSSRAWVCALEDGTAPIPTEPGLVWFDPAAGRLREHRHATMPA
jgi:transcriptional regulator with XRE-family HTH domain